MTVYNSFLGLLLQEPSFIDGSFRCSFVLFCHRHQLRVVLRTDSSVNATGFQLTAQTGALCL